MLWAGSRPFPATPMTAGHPDCRRDLMDCTSYALQQETALRRQGLIFETLTLCARGRVLSILLCISAWHREGANFGPHPSGMSFGGRRLELRLLQSGSAHGRFDFHCFPERLPRPRT